MANIAATFCDQGSPPSKRPHGDESQDQTRELQQKSGVLHAKLLRNLQHKPLVLYPAGAVDTCKNRNPRKRTLGFVQYLNWLFSIENKIDY